MTRTPELRPGFAIGINIADARGTRVWVDDSGALLLRIRGGKPRTLAAPGTLTTIEVVDAHPLAARMIGRRAHQGLVLFWAGDRVKVVICRDDLLLIRRTEFPRTHDDVVTGLQTVADALDVPLVHTGESPAVLPPPLPLLGAKRAARWSVVWVLLTTAAAGGALALAGRHGHLTSTSLLVLAVSFNCAWWSHNYLRERRHVIDLMARLDPDGRRVVSNAGVHTDNPGTTLYAQIGPDDIVLKSGEDEVWLPGPAAGGVRSAVSEPEGLIFQIDGLDAASLIYKRPFPGRDLEAVLRDTGITVTRSRSDNARRRYGLHGTMFGVVAWSDHAGGGAAFTTHYIWLTLFLLPIPVVVSCYFHPWLGAISAVLWLISTVQWRRAQRLGRRWQKEFPVQIRTRP